MASKPLGIKTWLAVFLAGLTLSRIAYLPLLPLAPDEAHYWDWSRRLAWGYFDGGPMIAWTIRLGTWLGGDSLWGVRLPAIFMGLAMSLLLFDFCRRVFKDEKLGFWLVVAANSSILFSLGGFIHTYDTPQVLFWLVSLNQAAAAMFDQKPARWYLAGLAAGLSMLAKYSSILLPAGLVMYLLTSARMRPWLRRKEPWLAALIAAAVFCPNLIWNAGHDWISFKHVLGLGGAAGQKIFTLPEFIGGQVLLIGPVMFFFLVWGLKRSWTKSRQGDEAHRFLLWTSLPVLALFLAMSTWTRVYGNWPGPGYLAAGLAAGASCFGLVQTSKAWRRAAVIGLVSGYLILGLVLVQAAWPLFKLKPDFDPSAEVRGWPQLGRVVEQTLKDWPGSKKPFIFGLRHQICSLVAFYTPGHPKVEGLFVPQRRLSQFLLWTDPARLEGRDGLGVVKENSSRQEYVAQMFKKVDILTEVDLKDPRGGGGPRPPPPRGGAPPPPPTPGQPRR